MKKYIVAVIGPYSSFVLLKREIKNDRSERGGDIRLSNITLTHFHKESDLVGVNLLDVIELFGADRMLVETAKSRIRRPDAVD